MKLANCIIAMIWLSLGSVGLTPVLAQDPGSELTLKQLVQQLGADTFADRQDAMQQLTAAGNAAIPPLAKAVMEGDPETRMRAVSVLARLATSVDNKTQRQAQDSLATLSQSTNQDVRQMARQAIRRLGPAMHARALRELKGLGVEIDERQIFAQSREALEFTISIGPDFSGSIDDYAMLGWLQGKIILTLIGKNISDDVIRKLATMRSLDSLVIKRGSITNDCLEPLSVHASLRTLHFYYVDLDDRCVQALAKMNRLAELRLFGTRISKERSTWLQEQMLTTEIDWRNGAFLGIYFNDTDGPCVVNNVVAGSAADRAGFRSNDQVIRFAGAEIDTGKQFLKAVADYAPGEKATAYILRSGKELALEFELGRFPDKEEYVDR